MTKIHRIKELIFKIVNEHFEAKASYDFLAKKYQNPIKILCKILNINRANYYKQRFKIKTNFTEIEIIKKYLKNIINVIDIKD